MLELGSGSGSLTRALLAAPGDFRVTAIEHDRDARARVRALARGGGGGLGGNTDKLSVLARLP